MALKPIQISFVSGNLVIQDYQNFTVSAATADVVVKITLPGGTEEVTVTDLGGSYTQHQNATPMTITPAAVTAGATSFLDGVYRINVTQALTSGDPLVTDIRVLYIPEIDACILKKTDSYLQASCNNCKSAKTLNLLQELVVVRQAAQLDINLSRFTAAAKKVTLLTNLCTGSSCACVCGC